jgi:hypothetical protein
MVLMPDQAAAAVIDSHEIRTGLVPQIDVVSLHGPDLGPEIVDEPLGLE